MRVVLVVVVLMLSGCSTGAPGAPTPEPADPYADVRPAQDGSLWPPGLEGPFDALPLEHVTVASFDGVVLEGWLLRPDLPDGVRAPTLVYSSPYLGTEMDSAEPDQFVRAGYAQARFSVRGTGNSGGCLDFFGADEQADQAVLVEWAAAQPWSNGRIGFYGSSYRGTTALQAAVEDPPQLAAVIAIAPVPDLMTLFATPDGALWNELPAQLAGAFAAIAAAPRALGDEPVDHITSSLGALTDDGPGRLCPEVADAFVKLQMEPAASDRVFEFFQERDLRPRLADVRVPLMWTDGFYDDQYWQGAHAWEQVTNAPFEYIAGPWPHTTPSMPDDLSFFDYMVQWFDYWLKGVGQMPPYIDQVLWQDTVTAGISLERGDGAWHTSAAWPPPEANLTTFNLTAGGLSLTEPTVERSYRSVQVPEGTSAPVLGAGGAQWPKTFLCPEASDAAEGIRLVYRTAGDTPALVAGIPTLDLTISSDAPGGLVNAFLLLEDADGESSCTDGGPGPALISFGTADLRFHDDIYNETDFPRGVPTHIQIEMTDLAQTIGGDQRLVLVLGAGNPADHLTRHAPTITIHPGTPDSPTGLNLPVIW